MRRLTTFAIGIVAATTVLAACGNDKKSGAQSGTTSPAGTAAAATTEPASGGDYCARIQAYKDTSDSFDSVFASDEVPQPAAVEEAFTTMQAMVHDLQNGAPAEIKADVDTMATSIDEVVALFSQYNWDLMALSTSPDMAALQEKLDGAEMQAVSDRLDAYSEGTCGIPSDS